MSEPTDVTFGDVERAITQGDPQLADLVIQYLEQPDPPEDRPEGAMDDDAEPLPAGTWTTDKLRSALSPHAAFGKEPAELRSLRREAFDGLLQAPHPPPRFRLGTTLPELYERGDEFARAALLDILGQAKIGWGIWRAFKTIYKRAEERHDAATFGVLAARLDRMSDTPTTGEVGLGTMLYLRRRAWRYLRQLGRAVPELYITFAVQVLRHYPKGHSFRDSWVANQIWAHEQMIGLGRPGWLSGPPAKLSERAFHEAWKASAIPLLQLLEDAQNDQVCDFAIRSLKEDFPENLQRVDVGWLARIGAKPLGRLHEFVVELMTDSPELHQSRLRELGLHEMVLSLLRSDSQPARKYAIEYARAHAPELSVWHLVELASEGAPDVAAFVSERLTDLAPQAVGLPALVRLLGVRACKKLATEKLAKGFAPSDLDAELTIVLATGTNGQRLFLTKFFAEASTPVPAAFLTQLLGDERCDWRARQQALQQLGKRPAREIGIEWIQQSLMDDELGTTVSGWLRQGKLAGDDLDVEWVKGLAMHPGHRALALGLLGNREIVAPARVGLGWLLAMARQADETLSRFAHRYLLEHFAPEDFAPEDAADRAATGVERLWALATGSKEPEPVRLFAATYLKVHHPTLGPTLAEGRALGLEPRLSHEAYTLARGRRALADDRADVRRFGAAIGRHELGNWADRGLLYELAASPHREPRGVGCDGLLSIGQPEAEPALPDEWLTAAAVFALAESAVKTTRETALTLLRRHYERLGGAERLAWLMESPDREVRLFAVRLLWQQHAPRAIPDDWTPPKQSAHAPSPGPRQRFESIPALRLFARTVLFGLPPGRMERRDDSGDALPERALPASVAKRRLIGVVRDMALEDREFAELIVPVLGEFLHSQAKGEWQSCAAALARIRQRHPSVPVPLAPATTTCRAAESTEIA